MLDLTLEVTLQPFKRRYMYLRGRNIPNFVVDHQLLSFITSQPPLVVRKTFFDIFRSAQLFFEFILPDKMMIVRHQRIFNISFDVENVYMVVR